MCFFHLNKINEQQVLNLGKSIKNSTYMSVYSNAINGVAAGTIITRTMSPWRIGTVAADVCLFTFALSGLVYVSFRMYKFKKMGDVVVSE